MTSDLYARLSDAGRTAVEIIRRERAGDLRSVVDLIATCKDDDDKALIIGALASVVNHTLAAIDELAVTHGEQIRGEALLAMMAIGLSSPDEGQSPG
jgi:hypothetical protein